MTKVLDSWSRTREVCSALIVLNKVDSTNSYLMNNTELSEYSVAISLNQTGGRGRWGREWVNRAGEGIAVSMVAPAPQGNLLEDLTLVPLAVGASVVSAINSISAKPVTMKWPNDILFDDKKLGGILCEVRRDSKIVVGIGLNLVFQGARPSERAVSLSDFLPVDAIILDDLVSETVRLLIRNLTVRGTKQRELIADALETIGKRVRVRGKDGVEWTGVALGIEVNGALRIRSDDGKEIAVLSSEVDHLYQ